MKLKTPLKKLRKKTTNLPPGTMEYKGKKTTTPTSIEIIDYNSGFHDRQQTLKVEDGFNYDGTDQITWININGLSNVQDIEKLGVHYNIHPLTLEDIVNTDHRPKLDEFENYLFVVLKMLYFKENDELTYEHISLIVGNGYVLTFQEADGDVFDDLRERIASGKGRIRNQGADYLMYAILDAVVDNYFAVIEAFGEKTEEIETKLFQESVTDNDMPNEIQKLKQEILKIRRSILPLREVINRLEKNENAIVESKTYSYLRDLYDHILQVSETIDLYREMIWSLMDMHMTIISNKMNEVMKVLTIIATIFIPLTFIAGIYGMNFKNMPELDTQNGYFILLGCMAVMFILMLIYFRNKKWL